MVWIKMRAILYFAQCCCLARPGFTLANAQIHAQFSRFQF